VPPGEPLRVPRASPGHPTRWLVAPGALRGHREAKKTAQFGPWVLQSENDRLSRRSALTQSN
jgi:hypothetical protein